VLYALAIGPLTQLFLPLLAVRVETNKRVGVATTGAPSA
jgi:hypothetical protein